MVEKHHRCKSLRRFVFLTN